MKKLLLFSFCFLFVCVYAYSYDPSEDPVQLSTASDIDQLMSNQNHWNKNFVLTNDIDCSGYSWTGSNPQPIGNFSNYFSGTFDGRGYTISNITYSMAGSNCVGFFGYIMDNPFPETSEKLN